jgi:hypothetical protein
VKFAKGDLIRVQPWRGSNYGREAGLYLVLETGLPRPLWAPPGRTGSQWASEEWIRILRLETGQTREDIASVYVKATKGKGKSP